jgi:NAD(P)-dependent dehydrogenase (short-subunit alcohol dehydrogenase family)
LGYDYENKLVLVTGASRGIGKSIALALAQDGAHVLCAATEAHNAGRVVAEIQAAGGEATAIGCRVENPHTVKNMFTEVLEQQGPIDVLINNAGISKPMLTMEMTEENWDQHMDINCKSIFLCSQAAALQMKTNSGGCIINIGSILGRNAFPATLGYCASKAAVDQMTKVMAIEWARYGIRVNCIAPGYIRTELIEQLAVDGKVKLEDLEKRTPQRRLGTGNDIANAVRYVASEDAAFMTGETLIIDGGWTAFGYYQT